jgi:hypothetical protein
MHIIYAAYYTAYLPLPQYIIRIRDRTTTTNNSQPETGAPITHASLWEIDRVFFL